MESDFKNPYEIPPFLINEGVLESVHKKKIPIYQCDEIVRKVDKDLMESVDLSDENDFEISIELATVSFPVHRQYRVCLLIANDTTRKLVNLADWKFSKLFEWLNNHRNQYNNKLILYCERESQKYFAHVTLDNTFAADRHLLLWARRVTYAPGETVEHVPLLLRQYGNCPDQFDLYLYLPTRCIPLKQRKVAFYGRTAASARRGIDDCDSDGGRGPKFTAG